jgi:hypothetical protein
MNPINGASAGEYTLPPPHAHVLPPADISAKVKVDLAALSHQGKVRENSYLVDKFWLVVSVQGTDKILVCTRRAKRLTVRLA